MLIFRSSCQLGAAKKLVLHESVVLSVVLGVKGSSTAAHVWFLHTRKGCFYHSKAFDPTVLKVVLLTPLFSHLSDRSPLHGALSDVQTRSWCSS